MHYFYYGIRLFMITLPAMPDKRGIEKMQYMRQLMEKEALSRYWEAGG
jgi:hypothetical protein